MTRGNRRAAGAAVTGWAAIAFAVSAPVVPGPATAQSDPGVADPFALELRTATGDLDDILERGLLRIGTVYNPIFLIYDGLEQHGMAVEAGREFEAFLKEEHDEAADTLTVVVKPLARDDLIPALTGGRVDILMANLTITGERGEEVAFSDPIRDDVREIVVTGGALSDAASFDDLVERGLHVRASSSYAESLAQLNAARKAEGAAPVPVHEADERLEDHDLLEMVAAGAIAATVVDDHKAALWTEVFDGLVVHDDLVLRENGRIAYAVRRDAPQLLDALNGFVAIAQEGTLLGNILIGRYYGDEERMVNALDTTLAERLATVIEVMQDKAESYGFEPLLIAAQGFQESRLDQTKRSPAGAVGVMQVRPETAADPNVDVPDIETVDGNVEAGVKYLRFVHDRYFHGKVASADDAVFLSLAAYNAGPRKIAEAREAAEGMGLKGDRWFENVEVAVAQSVGNEPVRYVRNILKYYNQYRAYQQLEGDLPVSEVAAD